MRATRFVIFFGLALVTLKKVCKNRDGSVGVATRYWLEGPRIESRWGRDFQHVSRPAPRPTQPPVQWAPGLSRR